MITSTSKSQECKLFFPRMVSRRNKNKLSYCSTNSINYEKELISQSKVKVNKVNFFQLSHITLEQYDKALIDSAELINSFDDELLYEMKAIEKLLSVQKHLLELFNYMINLSQTFDWNFFKRACDINELKRKMSNIDYEHISKKQLNFYLNRLTQYTTDFPRFIPQSLGMNHIYKWVKCQIVIFIYRINNRMLSQTMEDKSVSTFEEEAYKKVQNPFERNFLISNSMSSLDKTNTFCDEYTDTMTTRKESNFLTALPNSRVISIVNLNNLKKKEKKQNEKKVSESSLFLNGVNVMENKKKREEKVLQSLPLLKYRTFGQMRRYYKITKNTEDKVHYKHYDDLQQMGLRAINKDKFYSILSKNKRYILESLPEEKVKDLLES